MTKARISKVFDMSKYLSTKSGQELQDVLFYISELVNDFISCITNGLSYLDNFDCEYKTVSLLNGVDTVIGISKPNKRVTEIRVRQIISDDFFAYTSFGWKYNYNGEIIVNMIYSGTPPTNFSASTNLIIYYS